MKAALRFLPLPIAVTFWGCTMQSTARHDEPARTPGEEVGRAAYTVQKDAKKAAKEIGHELKTFGKDAKEGWHDARSNDRTKPAETKP